MSKCPDYYITSDGREFWEFYRDECHEIIDEYCILNRSQSHALESACEYLFRAGIKTVDPCDDIRKAFSLINRIMSMKAIEDSKRIVTGCVREVIGCVAIERAKKITSKADANQVDPIRTAWGTVTP